MKKITLCALSASLLVACGGGGGGGSTPAAVTPAPVPVPTTATMNIVIFDGLIAGATACLDVNDNGKCDAGEPSSGKSDASGKASIANVQISDIAKYAVVAEVPADAVDADNPAVKVGTAYRMSTPPGSPEFVSPVTTMTHNLVKNNGGSVAAATLRVKEILQLTGSPLSNVAGKADAESRKVADIGRVLVAARLQLLSKLKRAPTAAETLNGVDPMVDIDAAIQKSLLEILAYIGPHIGDEALSAADVTAVATAMSNRTRLTPARIESVVAFNKLRASSVVEANKPVPSVLLTQAEYSDAFSYDLYGEIVTEADLQATATSGSYTFSDFQIHVVASNGDPAGADWVRNLFVFNGKEWAACPAKFKHTSTVPDANGQSVVTLCDAYKQTRQRRSVDVAGKYLLDFLKLQLNLPVPFLTSQYDYLPYVYLGEQLPAGSKIFFDSYRTEVPSGRYDSGTKLRGVSGQAKKLEDFMTKTSANLVNPATPIDSANTYLVFSHDLDTAPENVVVGGSTVSFYPILQYRIAFASTGTARLLQCKLMITGQLYGCSSMGDAAVSYDTIGDARRASVKFTPAQMRAVARTGGLMPLASFDMIEREGAVFRQSKGFAASATFEFVEPNTVLADTFTRGLSTRLLPR